MCFGDEPETPAPPPPPAPPPVETPDLAIKGSEKKDTSKRKKKQTSGASNFRNDLSVNVNSGGSGLQIQK